MALSQKRLLFFIFAILLLGASPALSVPLSSGVGNPGAVAYGTSGTTDADGETVAIDGTADQTGSESRILEHNGRSTPGWVLPAAAVGAGGGALFALMSHGKSGDGSSMGANALDPSANLGASGSGGGITAMGTNNGSPGGNPSDVPEPGTILLMGVGIASILGGRRILSM
jgi:hypothetical protein